MSLRKPGRETDKEVMDYINSFSPSLCMAKWYLQINKAKRIFYEIY